MTDIISGTVVAVPDRIRELADWLNSSLADSEGLFQQTKGWLTDMSGVQAAGVPLRYDLAASRNGIDSVGPDLTPIGILPGWCVDESYWKTALRLKNQVDVQLLELYKRVVDTSSGDITTSLHAMVTTLVATLRAVAADYDKGSDQIMADLGGLATLIGSTSVSSTQVQSGSNGGA